MNSIIEVENLGKKYIIKHQDKSAGYSLLRESLNDSIKSIFHYINPFKKKKITEPITSEEVWALKNVTFDLKSGEKLGIIGRNGSGKSTLLKVLSRITQPTTGKIKIQGRVASLLEVGTGFHHELTGRENIFLNGAILGMTKAEINKKFDEIVSFAEVEKFLDTPVKFYSSGMYVRLAFAVAAHLEPDVLIVDEVLAVGDMQFQKKCIGKMEEAGAVGKTVLFVSHNMAMISNLCTRTILLSMGKIIENGETSNVIAKYIANNQGTNGIAYWENLNTAPGNKNTRLESVKIISENKVTSNVPIDKEICFEIKYHNFKDDVKLNTALHLRDNVGSFILSSANIESANLGHDKWYEKSKPTGTYTTTCKIPPNFLNNKTYSIDIEITNQWREIQIIVDNILSFSVHDSSETKKEYQENWVGVIRPKLEWDTEKC